MYQFGFEPVDCSLEGFMGIFELFGGKIVVFAGFLTDSPCWRLRDISCISKCNVEVVILVEQDHSSGLELEYETAQENQQISSAGSFSRVLLGVGKVNLQN